jgi:gas vesicle protein
MAHDQEREVVYVERGDAGLKPILLGALLGLAVGLLFAPQSGEETRRVVRRRLRKARALAEEKVGELSEKITSERPRGERRRRREDPRDEARSDLERRLAEARARRRTSPPAGEEEEPVA